MHRWIRLRWIIERIFYIAGILWIFAVCTAFVFIFLPKDDDNQNFTTIFTDQQVSPILTISYVVNISTDGLLIAPDLSELAEQIAKTYSTSRNLIRVYSVRFIQSVILLRQKRQLTSSSNVTNNNTAGIFAISFDIKYPPSCRRGQLCQTNFIRRFFTTVDLGPSEVPFQVSYSNGTTTTIKLFFQSLHQLVIDNTSNTITAVPETTILVNPTASTLLTTTATITSEIMTTSETMATSETIITLEIMTTSETMVTSEIMTTSESMTSLTSTTTTLVTTLVPPICTINCPLSYGSYDTTTTCGRICNDADNNYACDNATSTTNFCGLNRFGNNAIYIGQGFRAYGCGSASNSCGGNGELYLSTGGFTGCCAYNGVAYVCIVC
ncbi:hypothetical protein I4U23_004492 [Adineta vaga]|nr:hypothetical protein I4U23_004492 [Adineta vaga]